MNIYKWIWSHTPINRPFTFFLRDVWHEAEFVWIIALISVGVVLGHNFDWLLILKVMGIFTTGYIAGHLFWGKEYQENQGLPPKDKTLVSK